MASVIGTAKAPCVNCREPVEITERYAQGDHIKCGACGTDHKILRGDRVRLVLADVSPLRDALAQNGQLVRRLESDLGQARASYGIGVNGFGVGLIYAIYQVVDGASISTSLIVGSLVVALIAGGLLEGANWLFLAKRQKIDALTRDLAAARAEASRLRAQIRDATRG